jgi:GDPmannose 4,6-dehydratase
MYLMLQQSEPDDYVIATGESCKLEDFVATAFASVGLNWQDHVISDKSLLRPTDLAISRGNPNKAREKLAWQAQYKMPDIVRVMVENRLQK